MARGTIRSSPLPRAAGKLQLLDLNLGFIAGSYCIGINSQKGVVTTACDVVYPMYNTLQLRCHDIIGKRGKGHQVK